jgi:caspase domain-containing protein
MPQNRVLQRTMAADDWAVVVGVRLYPDLGNLDGPENDALAVHEWITSPHGGNVPVDQVALILSSKYPAAPTPNRAEPTTQTIDEAFEDLQALADQNGKLGNGRRAGRRLYIYMAGHGCAPRLLNDSALLTANASSVRSGHHILGRLSAEWFLRSNFFDETVLLMDCCRENWDVPPRVPPYINVTGADALDLARAFYGFGTKWSRLSRERVMDDGKVHGVFTWALLQGLKTAADPVTGEVTAARLADYLYNNMKAFLKPEDLADPEVPKEPDLDYDKNPNSRFVFCVVPPAPVVAPHETPVNIALPPQAAGKRVQVLDARFAEVRAAQANPPAWQIQLPPGSYIAQVLELGRQTPPFNVPETGAVDVAL